MWLNPRYMISCGLNVDVKHDLLKSLFFVSYCPISSWPLCFLRFLLNSPFLMIPFMSRGNLLALLFSCGGF